jgi:hypothetical protein
MRVGEHHAYYFTFELDGLIDVELRCKRVMGERRCGNGKRGSKYRASKWVS